MSDLDKQKYMTFHQERINITLSKLKEHKNNFKILMKSMTFLKQILNECTKTGTFHNQKSMHKISMLIYLVEIATDCLACTFTSDTNLT